MISWVKVFKKQYKLLGGIWPSSLLKKSHTTSLFRNQILGKNKTHCTNFVTVFIGLKPKGHQGNFCYCFKLLETREAGRNN
jgi:hypothetical protein